MIRYRLRRKESYSSLLVEGKYKLEYPIGETVTAPEGTLGIFCFETKEDIIKFIEESGDPLEWEIYRVNGIGNGITPTEICLWFREISLDEYYKSKLSPCQRIPTGLICYDQVTVLD